MSKKKHFIVLGLGKFGGAVAKRLHQNGCHVTGVDIDEERVVLFQDELDGAVIADSTNREALEQLSVDAVDGVFLGLGGQYEPSILATLHLKELKARRILAKVLTPEHGRILKKLGVDQVIFPEEQAGIYWADKETWPNVVDFLTIDPDFSLIEITVPDSLVGKTLQEADLRNTYGIFVIAIKDVCQNRLTLIPPSDYRMTDDQLLLILGRHEDLERFRALK